MALFHQDRQGRPQPCRFPQNLPAGKNKEHLKVTKMFQITWAQAYTGGNK